jgi:hypothetical protein
VSGLLGPNGQPISSKTLVNKKAAPPALGEKYGTWGGPDLQFFTLPGGGAIQFDLNALDLADYREMRDHYQINNSLIVLTFLLHQMEWKIEGVSNPKERDFYTEQLSNNWTPLVRSKATAFWAGFSPNVLKWDNDTPSRRIVLSKVKDLVPEDAHVNWKKVPGAGTHKISIYDGIKQYGGPTIPVANSYWYPLMMEYGNMSGRKLLRSAFQPWFFSILVHLFANRYYERFGEPTPIGRAPYEDEIRFAGREMRGNEAMELILTALRNRSVVVLPNEKTPYGDETNPDFDYSIEYLESQMRGADFERYMTRLDEEMSLALFTPILMMRTADVGSYNLGTQHSIIYQWLLNAISGDWKFYIDWYLLRPMRDYNFGTNADLPKIKFRFMGQQNQELVKEMSTAVVAAGKAKPDYTQLGDMAGLTLTEVQELTAPPDQPVDTPPADKPASTARLAVDEVVDQLQDRVRLQVNRAFNGKGLRDLNISWGFQSKLEVALKDAGFAYPDKHVKDFYQAMETWADDIIDADRFSNAKAFMRAFRGMADYLLDELFDAGEAA